jgi:DNA modification methylase
LTPDYQSDDTTIYRGDALETLRQMPSESVDCCVTSPPYYRLRNYGVAGQIGLEDSPAAFVVRLVEVFEEVRRVLTKQGTLWMNLGDSFSASGMTGGSGKGTLRKEGKTPHSAPKISGGELRFSISTVGSNLLDFLHGEIKGGSMFVGGRSTLTITSESQAVLKPNHALPNLDFACLLGVKRILFKQGQNDLGQVINLLDSECRVRIGRAVSWVRVDEAATEITVYAVDNLRVIVTENDLDTESAFGIPSLSVSAEHADVPLSVEETGEPIAESIGDIQPNRDAVSFDTSGEGLLQVDTINQAVPLADALVPCSEFLCDFRITKASKEHFAFSLMDGRVQFTVGFVRHLFFSNRFGSLIHYTQQYDKAERMRNKYQPKQLLGVPWMVVQALQEAGWILRTDCIWHKPNAMPESVKDRPTRDHEYLFLLAKSKKYFYDAEAIKEPAAFPNGPNSPGSIKSPHGQGFTRRANGGVNSFRGQGRNRTDGKGLANREARDMTRIGTSETRNKRTVWAIATTPFREAHFATFPPNLIRPCILAGCPKGGTVLDPFMGSGTTALVARQEGRKSIGIELNRAYIEIASRRLDGTGSATLEAQG